MGGTPIEPTNGSAGRPAPGAVMAAEMAEQPARLASLLARGEDIARELRSVVPDSLAGTVLVARGSSDNAARCGGYMLEMATRRPVTSASPSVHNLYGATIDFSGYLMIAVSQSGRTPEIVDVVEKARRTGACTVAVTNDPDSPLASAASMTVDLGVGRELAVPATKTVTAQIVCFALLAQALGDIGLDERAASALPDQVEEALRDQGPAADIARWLAPSSRMATVARGLLYGAAGEVALKIEETTGKLALGFSAADLRHGPIAIARTDVPILAFAHPGPASADVLELVDELRARGADTRLAGPFATTDLSWSSAAPEILAPVLAVVRGQQVSLELSLALGLDPDAPAGLTKVTVT
ncbi:MAG TPA: SIS domain-containing protein [Acidimicrobiales bacterium]|nr:SIS domain-containing protein [Acidimicrobiales bacterium]